MSAFSHTLLLTVCKVGEGTGMGSSPSQPPEHDAAHGSVDHRHPCFGEALVIAREPARAREPSEGTLDHPSERSSDPFACDRPAWPVGGRRGMTWKPFGFSSSP